MTAPTERSGGIDANARGIAVLVITVVVAALLLWKAGDGGSSTKVNAEAPVTSTTLDTTGLTDPNGTTTLPGDTTLPGTPETPTTAAGRQPADVSVVVLNGGGVVGAAGTASTKIGETGYQMGEPKNATDAPNVEATAVYYAEGFQPEATVVAGILGKEASIVQAMPTPVPGPGAESANVAVVLGKDATAG